ncbi:MAG: hypothetical protein KZQ58_03820, partial [gamma proteobacterium symbiont of Bathyaustriella thionipta]|nr:hypothetical protein [gamma proteobacterium symbiont of Bathyaustriella thionipta]
MVSVVSHLDKKAPLGEPELRQWLKALSAEYSPEEAQRLSAALQLLLDNRPAEDDSQALSDWENGIRTTDVLAGLRLDMSTLLAGLLTGLSA